MSEYLQVITTTGSPDEAVAIGRQLVEQGLAACVQVGGPITSIYRWQGKLEQGEEWTCLIKTRRELYAPVEAAIRELHSYDTPEILATEVCQGSDRYLQWLASETAQRSSG